MYRELEEIARKPDVFAEYTAYALWGDDYRSKRMLAHHLNESIDLASRNTEFIEMSCSWIIDHFRLGGGKSVCDFGCGPGLYASRLAHSGAHVTGLDFSSRSIRYARETAKKESLAINYVCGDYLEYQSKEHFDLITMIMCDFCALSSAQRRSVLTQFSKCLKENGAILLDVYSMTAFDARENASRLEKNQLDHFWCAEDYYCFVNSFKYEDEAVILDKYSVLPRSGEPETVYNWLQYFSPDSLARELQDAGFEVSGMFKDVSGAPFCNQHPEFAIVATKV